MPALRPDGDNRRPGTPGNAVAERKQEYRAGATKGRGIAAQCLSAKTDCRIAAAGAQAARGTTRRNVASRCAVSPHQIPDEAYAADEHPDHMAIITIIVVAAVICACIVSFFFLHPPTKTGGPSNPAPSAYQH